MDRESAKKKVAALSKMTRAAGCSEAEALSAATKAAEIMREFGISDEEVQSSARSAGSRTSGHSVRDKLWAIVAFCTNTVPVFEPGNGAAGKVTFIGPDPGPDVAVYLFDVLRRAIDSEVKKFKSDPFYRRRRSLAKKRAAVRDFTEAMVQRLSRRLVDLFSSTISKTAHSLAAAARDSMYGDLVEVKNRAQPEITFDEAAASGWAAGGDVNLSHGVEGGEGAGQLRQIGRAS